MGASERPTACLSLSLLLFLCFFVNMKLLYGTDVWVHSSCSYSYSSMQCFPSTINSLHRVPTTWTGVVSASSIRISETCPPSCIFNLKAVPNSPSYLTLKTNCFHYNDEPMRAIQGIMGNTCTVWAKCRAP